MSLSQAGYLDYGFIGAAQIDRYGNINTTAIGDYQHPTTRLPGSGGANDVASLSHHTIIIMRQDTRKFVEQVDFLTTPGYLSGSGAREAAGLPAGGGRYDGALDSNDARRPDAALSADRRAGDQRQ